MSSGKSKRGKGGDWMEEKGRGRPTTPGKAEHDPRHTAHAADRGRIGSVSNNPDVGVDSRAC
jgi:hypothetical protein